MYIEDLPNNIDNHDVDYYSMIIINNENFNINETIEYIRDSNPHIPIIVINCNQNLSNCVQLNSVNINYDDLVHMTE